jgi:hypothetical protein
VSMLWERCDADAPPQRELRFEKLWRRCC